MNYLVATTKSWNIEAFSACTPDMPGTWHLITQPAQLNKALLDELKPIYIFFPHWSWRVAEDITTTYPCVCFHMTDLPFGRGGSPLQNLISQGIKQTQLTALRMSDELDAGPIYAKYPLDLSGTAQQIFERAAPLTYYLINRIVTEKLLAQPQNGDVVYFSRRLPSQSQLPSQLSSEALYDFIRMLDAETYPNAYLEYGHWRLEFSRAESTPDGTVMAKVRFTPRKGTE
ncbi:methionyl-tRNA formyltransferase [Shewanella baltica]|uniref:methionyl-tRNA formyltransferase n=1 Tax=Shewanella baltica TaxID=62322 RepID=UPI003D797187